MSRGPWKLLLLAFAVAFISCGSDFSVDGRVVKKDPEDWRPKVEAPLIPQIKGKLQAARWLRVRPVHWRVSKITGSREVQIYTSLGYCVGSELPPRFAGYRLSRRGKSLHITPYAAKLEPRYTRAYSAMLTSRDRRVDAGRLAFPLQKRMDLCRGGGYYAYAMIKLNQGIEDVKLYDATTSPPSLRWSQSTGVS